ncbi:putative gustatory receptor 28b [Episyrphus balteatus]|uniref:putative gustatory receptor 28b n=1 Tax=Episyrphus balteatus TaxID=286459 RepID=UPI0024866526|nr:putative gustatory receptor 28b [Episyrphus balteatus]
MRTKIIPVDPYYLYDPKKEFSVKIDERLSTFKRRQALLKLNRPSNKFIDTRKNKKSSFQRFSKNSIFEKDIVSKDDLLPLIDSAMKLQQNAFEAAMFTNRSYDVQLALIFLEAFISILFNVYFMISVFVAPAAFKLPMQESIAYLAQHLIQPSLNILVVVLGFSLLKHVFRKTQQIVNKIIIHSKDKEIRERFSQFSQQMQVNNPEFSVLGFFPLDGSVIFSIISATTTYLIILIQALGGESEVIPALSSFTNKGNESSKIYQNK